MALRIAAPRRGCKRKTEGGTVASAALVFALPRRAARRNRASVHSLEKTPAIRGRLVLFERERVPIDSISLRTSSM